MALALLFGQSVIPGSTNAAAATKKKKVTTPAKPVVAPGKPCSKIGERAAGTNLDCVKVGSAAQWQSYGSKLNPIKLNDAAEYSSYEKNRYRLKITGITQLTAADIKQGGDGKYAIPVGMSPVSIGAELTYLGPEERNDLPALLTDLVSVDGAGRKYDTYAGDDKDGGECSQFGDVPSNNTRNLVRGTPLTSGFCIVMKTGPLTSVLINISSESNNDPGGLWFKTT